MDVFIPKLKSSLAIKIAAGVLPVPPIYTFPMQIIGILKTLISENNFFKQITKIVINDNGNNIIAKILIFFFIPEFWFIQV